MRASDELGAALAAGDWETARAVLARLSCSEARRMEREMRERVLPAFSSAVFWPAWAWLVAFRPQAYLQALAGCARLAKADALGLDTAAAQAAAESITSEQAGKAVSIALPHMRTPEQVEQLLQLFVHAGAERLAAALVRETSPLAYYGLAQVLHACTDSTLAMQCCKALLRKGDDLSRNMVSLLRVDFGLDALQGALSLQVEPYELSFVYASYANFCYTLEGKRPKAPL